VGDRYDELEKRVAAIERHLGMGHRERRKMWRRVASSVGMDYEDTPVAGGRVTYNLGNRTAEALTNPVAMVIVPAFWSVGAGLATMALTTVGSAFVPIPARFIAGVGIVTFAVALPAGFGVQWWLARDVLGGKRAARQKARAESMRLEYSQKSPEGALERVQFLELLCEADALFRLADYALTDSTLAINALPTRVMSRRTYKEIRAELIAHGFFTDVGGSVGTQMTYSGRRLMRELRHEGIRRGILSG